MRKLRLINLNDLKKMKELVRGSSWSNLHAFYNFFFFLTGTVTTAACEQLTSYIFGLLGKTIGCSLHKVFSIPGNASPCHHQCDNCVTTKLSAFTFPSRCSLPPQSWGAIVGPDQEWLKLWIIQFIKAIYRIEDWARVQHWRTKAIW